MPSFLSRLNRIYGRERESVSDETSRFVDPVVAAYAKGVQRRAELPDYEFSIRAVEQFLPSDSDINDRVSRPWWQQKSGQMELAAARQESQRKSKRDTVNAVLMGFFGINVDQG